MYKPEESKRDLDRCTTHVLTFSSYRNTPRRQIIDRTHAPFMWLLLTETYTCAHILCIPHTHLLKAPASTPLAALKAIQLKSQSRLVCHCSVKCSSVIKEESLLWLGCLFQFQIQSFVLYCCFFPLTAQSHAPPHHLLAEPCWELNPHWLEDTLGRIWEVFFCLHDSRENPNNNCYLRQPCNLQLARQISKHKRCKLTHTHTYIEVTRCPKQAKSLFFYSTDAGQKKYGYVHTFIMTSGNNVISLSDQTL